MYCLYIEIRQYLYCSKQDPLLQFLTRQKNLYKNEDYITLEKVFRSYSKMMEKSFEQGELFAEDDEIFDIYVDVLEKTGKTVQRSKIGTLI